MLVYKLTDQQAQTYGGCQWGEGVEHTAPGGGPLCTDRWIHAYVDPLLAVFFDPVHGNFGAGALLWEADGDVGEDDGTKLGCTRLRTLRQIPMPLLTTDQLVTIAILATRTVYQEPRWTLWADRWLSGEDRSGTTAWAACAAARAWAACAAAKAARTAAGVAWEAAWEAAWAAAWAASAGALSTLNATALDAASAVQSAVEAARFTGQPLDLVAVVHQVVEGGRVDGALSDRSEE